MSSPESPRTVPTVQLNCRDVESIRALRTALDRAHYGELMHLVRPIHQLDLPWPIASSVFQQIKTLRPEEGALVRLFGLGEAVDERDVEGRLPTQLVSALVESGLLVRRGSEISTSGLCVVPFQGLYVLANPPPTSPTARQRQPDVCLDRDSIFLARLLKPRGHERTLELCSGSGVLALSAARTDLCVTGLEYSEVAVAAATFSALLNGLEDRLEFKQSDLFGKAEGRYDLVLVNPPYAPVPPGSCSRFLAGDGGIDGLCVLRKILGELDSYLTQRGCAMIIAGSLSTSTHLLFEDELRALCRTYDWHATLHVIDRKPIEEHVAQMRPFVDDPEHYKSTLLTYCRHVDATHYCGFYLNLAKGLHPTKLDVIDVLPSRSDLVRALRHRKAGTTAERTG